MRYNRKGDDCLTRIGARTILRSTRIEYSPVNNGEPTVAYVDGLITSGQIKVISSALGDSMKFCPDKVGLPLPNTGGPICRFNINSMEHSVNDPTVQISICELVGKFKALH